MATFLSRSLALLLLAPLLHAQESVEVRVLRPDGSPAGDLEVAARVGLAHFTLAEDFDRWSSVRTLEERTKADGRARFAGLPPSSRVTVFARTEGLAGLAEGPAGGELVLTLAPTGALAGKVATKLSLRGYSVQAVGAHGLDVRKVELGSDGEWELDGIPCGEVVLELRLGNWTALRKTVEVKPGKPVKVPALKLGEEFLIGADPLVDVRRVKLVGTDKKPLVKTMFCWSSPWMDGGMPADEEGEVQLEGGGVAIGPPPFVLRLGSVGGGFGQEPTHLGKLVGIQRGTAVVEAALALEPLTLRVLRSASPIEAFQAFAVTGADEPRVWHGKLEGGAARFLVPPGPLRLFVGTADGRVTEQAYEKGPGASEHALTVADG